MHRELVIELSVNHVSTEKVCAIVCSLCTAVTIVKLLHGVSLVDRGTVCTGGVCLRIRYWRDRCLERWLGGCRITSRRKADTLSRCRKRS